MGNFSEILKNIFIIAILGFIAILIMNVVASINQYSKDQESVFTPETVNFSNEIDYTYTRSSGVLTGRLTIPIYNDYTCLNSGYLISELNALTFVQQIYYSDDGVNLTNLGTITTTDGHVGTPSYNLENAPIYSYFKNDGKLFRISWGENLELLSNFQFSIFWTINNNYSSGTYTISHNFPYIFHAEDYMGQGILYQNYLSYLDGVSWQQILQPDGFIGLFVDDKFISTLNLVYQSS